jgi:hypothetical protein
MVNAILVIRSAQNGSQTPTDGTQSVDPKIETLTAALKAIRDRADAALKDVEQSVTERRSLGWKCMGCGNVKHFTRPAFAEVAAPCPKCRGTVFEPC